MELVDKIFSIIAPHLCLICDEEGFLVCEPCLESGATKAISICIGCKRLARDGETCKRCKYNFPIEATWAASDYDYLAREIIAGYKYDSKRAVGALISDQMLKVLPKFDCIVTGVPTAPVRVRQRGFDHASRLAKSIATKRQLPYLALLRRTNNTHQVGSSRGQRAKQAEGLFSFSCRNSIQGKTILLIDDVITTGATVRSAARELRRAGAEKIYVLAFARKQ